MGAAKRSTKRRVRSTRRRKRRRKRRNVPPPPWLPSRHHRHHHVRGNQTAPRVVVSINVSVVPAPLRPTANHLELLMRPWPAKPAAAAPAGAGQPLRMSAALRRPSTKTTRVGRPATANKTPAAARPALDSTATTPARRPLTIARTAPRRAGSLPLAGAACGRWTAGCPGAARRPPATPAAAPAISSAWPHTARAPSAHKTRAGTVPVVARA